MGQFVGRKLNDTDRLYQDLLLTGDDAYELLAEIKRRFGTSFDTLDFAIYFGEGDRANWLLHLNGYRDPNCRESTVGHLLNVIEAGHWFEPPGMLLQPSHALSLLDKLKQWGARTYKEAFLFFLFPFCVCAISIHAVGTLMRTAIGQISGFSTIAIICAQIALGILGYFHYRSIRALCERVILAPAFVSVMFFAIWMLYAMKQDSSIAYDIGIMLSVIYLALPCVARLIK
jgi:hypothetical protein